MVLIHSKKPLGQRVFSLSNTSTFFATKFIECLTELLRIFKKWNILLFLPFSVKVGTFWGLWIFLLFSLRDRNDLCCPTLLCLLVFSVKFIWFHFLLRLHPKSFLPETFFFLWCCLGFSDITVQSALFSGSYCTLLFSPAKFVGMSSFVVHRIQSCFPFVFFAVLGVVLLGFFGFVPVSSLYLLPVRVVWCFK